MESCSCKQDINITHFWHKKRRNPENPSGVHVADNASRKALGYKIWSEIRSLNGQHTQHTLQKHLWLACSKKDVNPKRTSGVQRLPKNDKAESKKYFLPQQQSVVYLWKKRGPNLSFNQPSSGRINPLLGVAAAATSSSEGPRASQTATARGQRRFWS